MDEQSNTQIRRAYMVIHSESEHRVTNGDKVIPVIAFFGTKGGVGKTTVVDKFATIVARSPRKPNVLMVDFDVHHRGLTVLRTRDQITDCRTIHEYIADNELAFQKAQDVTHFDPTNANGKEYLIPSSNLAAEHVFSIVAKTKPALLVERLTSLFTQAASKYNIDLILIDCGPIVDPLTASAAFMSDMAFIIGQNEPITFQSLQNYAIRIRDFLPAFNAAKVRVILNKVRGSVLQKTAGLFATIPFTMEVVDYAEGLPNIDEIRLIYLDYCIYEIVKRVFSTQNSDLTPGPEAVLTDNQMDIINTIDEYSSSKWYGRLLKKNYFYIAGAVAVLLALASYLIPKYIEAFDATKYQWLGGIPWIMGILGLILLGFGVYMHVRIHAVDEIIKLKKNAGYEGLLELLTTREKRQKFNDIRMWSERTQKELKK